MGGKTISAIRKGPAVELAAQLIDAVQAECEPGEHPAIIILQALAVVQNAASAQFGGVSSNTIKQVAAHHLAISAMHRASKVPPNTFSHLIACGTGVREITDKALSIIASTDNAEGMFGNKPAPRKDAS